MKKSVALVCCWVLLGSQSVWAMTPRMYSRVMDAVDNRNLQMLKQITSSGVDMNSPAPNGMTPLCETVAQGDYEGYEMLLTQGASPYVSCMRQLPQHQVASFYANQPAPHTYYSGHMMEATATSAWGKPALAGFEFPTLGVGEVLLGGVAAAGILTLGHGGSGGGGGGNDRKWDAPLSLDPKTFETTEYKASSWTQSVDFLGAVKASDAYARGYTGYYVKRKSNGALDGKGEDAIDKTKRVKVAVMDEGVYSNHPDLKANIGSQYNFVYGACSASNNGKCWTFNKGGCVGQGTGEPVDCVELHANGADSDVLDRRAMTEVDWLMYKTRYKDYVYNPSNATPSVDYKFKGTDGMLYGRYQDGNGDWYLYDEKTKTSYKLGCEDDTGMTCWYDTDESNKVTAVADYQSHGTFVAGLVGATKNDEKMMGVAYNADVIPVKMDIPMNSFYGLTEAVNVADIVNLSIAAGGQNSGKHFASKEAIISDFEDYVDAYPGLIEGYRAAATQNKILVFSAGNYTEPGEGQSGTTPFDPSRYTIAPLSDLFNGKKTHEDGKTYNLTNLLVNVVALNSDNKTLATYSAKCGATKDYCIAAPGGDWASDGQKIHSTYYDGAATSEEEKYTYRSGQGTSFAAPIVSGALAVIKGAFPHLTNQEVVEILFETATDLGDPGVDEIYGHGLVNLAAATDPVGLQEISLDGKATGEKAVAAASTSTVPAAFAGIAKALPAQMIVLDKYNRAFARPTSSFVRVAKRENKLDAHFKSFMRGNEKVVADTETFKMAYSERRSKLDGKGMQQGSMSFEVRPSEKWGFKTFYTENTETSGGNYFERIMRAPYAKMKEAWGGAISYNLGKNWQASVLGQIGQNGFVDEDDLNDMDHNKVSLFQSTLQYTGLKKVGLKMTAGVSNEQGATLGMWGKGAFKSGNSKTSFVGAGLTFNLTDALTVEGMYYTGVTHVENSQSLVKMSDLRSDSFAITAAWKVDDAKTFGLQFVSPLRVRRGTASVDLPVARDAYQDVVYRKTVKASLKPSAREYDVGLYFSDDIQEDVHFQSELGVRLNPDHVAGATPDWRALVGLRLGL